ncbi:hypothetical protein M404DRAFT_146095 [Pisolithus tinctorius Marx 270]|uniref:Winged helix-turn helix domain-containing protein n=1 Tax=Pisolithus tinctorius Marx 270 TaxID=870435 RepID=A0A0C3J2C7_PISTI|nr:hypothetical protein M404DRAFT_146095 [Pisolithus tinctorius Marx 270]
MQKIPNLYLDELQEMIQASCGTEVSHAMVWRTLCRYGFTMKKSAQHKNHLEYLTCIGAYTAEQLVFVDESSVDHQTTYHGHAWSIKGTKVQCKAFFVCG